MAFLSLLMGLTAAFGPNDFTLVMPVSPETAEGQRLLLQRAVEICGARYPNLHRYRFSGLEQLGPSPTEGPRFEVQQEMTCSDSPLPQPTGEAAPSDWQPADQDTRDVLALSNRYFDALDTGDAQAAHEHWSEDQQSETPIDQRRREIDNSRREGGARRAAPSTRLTWYVNPVGAPRPGIYVAVDYERFNENLSVNCGYLVWYREGASRYRLTRQETSVAPRDLTGMSADQLDQLRQSARCPT